MTRLVIVFLLALLALIVGIGIYQAIRISRLVNMGKALANSAQPFEQHPPKSSASILVIGDSSAVGVGASQPADSIAGLLGHRYPNATITNRGISGLRVAGLLSALRSQLIKPDEHFGLILIQIGGNDTTHLTNYAQVETDLSAALELVKKSSASVALMSTGNFATVHFFPTPLNYYFGHRSKVMRDLFVRLAADKGVAYVDLYEPLGQNHFEKDPDHFYAADMFHLNSYGYEWWFTKVSQTIDTAGIKLP